MLLKLKEKHILNASAKYCIEDGGSYFDLWRNSGHGDNGRRNWLRFCRGVGCFNVYLMSNDYIENTMFDRDVKNIQLTTLTNIVSFKMLLLLFKVTNP